MRNSRHGSCLVGANSDDVAVVVDSGDGLLFRRTKGAWTERATLVAADSAAGDECGVSVALGSGGAPGASLALVGGFKHDTAGAADAGRVWAWSITPASLLRTPKMARMPAGRSDRVEARHRTDARRGVSECGEGSAPDSSSGDFAITR